MAARNVFDFMQNELCDEPKENDTSDMSDEEFIPPSDDSDMSDAEVSPAEDLTDDSSDDDVTTASDDSFLARDGIRWSRVPLPKSRTPSRNIIRQSHPKVVNVGGHLENPLQAFSLFFPNEVIDIIVKYTNLYAKTKSANWTVTDRDEIRAVFGILIISGFTQNNMANTDVLWSMKYGVSIIRSTMSRNRFQELLTYLRFDDREERVRNPGHDKLAPIRQILTMVNENLQKYYVPGVDEQLVPFRGRCSFKQYLPMKPDKYGLKLFWIVDAKTFYPLQCYPYLGKEDGKTQTGLGEKVVTHLTRKYIKSGRNVTMDNYFTSLNLATDMEKDGLTLIGTVRQNRKFVPKEFLKDKSRPVESSLFGYREKSTLVSYVPKKSKSVILLSTMHSDGDVVAEAKNKPEIIMTYNETKGGVDSLDQLAHRYMTKRRTKRWPLVYLMNLIDIAGIAAFVVWSLKHPEWYTRRLCKRRLFLETLGEEVFQRHDGNFKGRC